MKSDIKISLSKSQTKVMKLMQEGWELGSTITQIGFTILIERAWLQKNGIGHGDPIEDTKIVTVNALIRKGLIKRLPSKSPMIDGHIYRLTEKGKAFRIRK